MNNKETQILLVDDDSDLIQLIRVVLENQDEQLNVTVAFDLCEARTIIAQSAPNLVIVDLVLPDGNGIELIPTPKEAISCPFIILTAHGNERMAVEALKKGALDYVVKGQEAVNHLPRVIQRALQEWNHIIERKRAEQALERANRELESRIKARTSELLETNRRLQQQISEHKKARQALQERFHMEEMVAAIATRFINLPQYEIDDAIQMALQDIGEFTTVDRSYLFLLSEDQSTISNTHEWCTTGIFSHRQNLQDLSIEPFEWAVSALRRGEILHIPSIERLPEEARPLKEIVQGGNIKSILNIPIFWENELRGFIGFDSVWHHKQWGEKDLTLLQTVASIFSNAIHRQKTENRLRHSEARLAESQHIAQLGSWELDLIKNELTWSMQVFRIFELDKEEFKGTYEAFLDHIHPDDRDLVNRLYTESLKNKTPYDIVHRLRLKNGLIKYVHERCETIYDDNGKPLRSIGTVQDVTERVTDEEQLRLAASVFESTVEGVVITDAHINIIAVNRAFTEISGFTEKELLGKNPRIMKSNHHDRAYFQSMWASILKTGHWRGEIWDRNKAGETYPAWLTINVVRNANQQITHYIGTLSDISALKHSEAKLDHLAHHDALTNLPNRLLLSARLEHCIERVQREQGQVAVLFLDLDDFKQINDGLGHPVGDEVLKQVGARLYSRLRSDDTVARLGGDEFVIVMGLIDSARNAAMLAEELLIEIAKPILVEKNELYVTGSIGISIFPQDGEDIATLLRNSDTAMYRAKEQRQNSYQFYTTRFTTDALKRMRLQTDLRRALENQEFEIHYQMQVELGSARIIGAEALVRWHHPEMGLVYPAQFIPLAEQTGLITELSEWVLRNACKQWVCWKKVGLILERIAVNLSGRQIHEPNLVQRVARILEETGCSAHHLELEVSEGFIMQEVDRAQKILGELRALDVSLAIDDFGTGYSSLTYLKRLPISKLKIDRAFVSDVPADPEDAAITRAVIALGKNLHLKVIAEGVENENQLDFLQQEGCDEIQGYLYGRPLPSEPFIRHLKQWTLNKKPKAIH